MGVVTTVRIMLVNSRTYHVLTKDELDPTGKTEQKSTTTTTKSWKSGPTPAYYS